MHGYKVLTKQGLKGPFKKSSILKAVTTAMLPLQARLLDLSTGCYVVAAELVGEQVDQVASHAEPKPAPRAAEDGLELAEEAKPEVEKTPRVILRGKIPLKQARLPKPRKLRQSDPDELELNYPAARSGPGRGLKLEGSRPESGMIGFKVLTRQGLKGPFKKSSILKAVTSAQIPLQARLLDLETGRYLSAAELVGEEMGNAFESEAASESEQQELSGIHDHVTEDSNELKLDDETGSRD